MKPISRADVAWHILTVAEDPAPGQRTPVITSGGGRRPSRPGTGDRTTQVSGSR